MANILYYQKLLFPDYDGHIDKFYATCSSLKKKAIYPQIMFQEKPPALFVKACDIIGINPSFKSICILSENLSIIVCFLFYALLFGICWKIFRKYPIIKN